ncbi:MAG TPA: protein kinase [Kofleriaceae bacterium]|nr:protein kinase [Kofleriaceae bacterium]
MRALPRGLPLARAAGGVRGPRWRWPVGGSLATGAAVVVALAGAVPGYYIGPTSAFSALVALCVIATGVLIGGPDDRGSAAAWLIYGGLAAGQAIACALLLLGVLPDRAMVPFSMGALGWGQVGSAHAFLQLVYLAAFLGGRGLRRRYRALGLQIEESTRAAARREALLEEARSEYRRALLVGRSTWLAGIGGRALGGELGGTWSHGDSSSGPGGEGASVALAPDPRARPDERAPELRAPARVDAPDLGAWLRASGPLPVDDLRALVDQIGRAVEDLHAGGEVHLDVRPRHIRRVSDPSTGAGARWTLVHAAAAQIEAARDPGADPSALLAYAAPERLHGAHAGAPADLYGLTASLYVAVTGCDPYDTGEAAVRGAGIDAGAPRDPRARGRRADAGVAAVLRIGLASAPADRFASAAELRRAFLAALDGTLDDGVRAAAAALEQRDPWRPVDDPNAPRGQDPGPGPDIDSGSMPGELTRSIRDDRPTPTPGPGNGHDSGAIHIDTPSTSPAPASTSTSISNSTSTSASMSTSTAPSGGADRGRPSAQDSGSGRGHRRGPDPGDLTPDPGDPHLPASRRDHRDATERVAPRQPDPRSADAWHRAYLAMMRAFCTVVTVLCVAGGFYLIVIVDDRELLHLAWICLAGIVVAAWLHWTLVRHRPGVTIVWPWVVAGALTAGPAMAIGLHTGFAAIVTVLVFAGGMFRGPVRGGSRDRRVMVLVGICAAHAAAFALIATGAVGDHGSIPVFTPRLTLVEATLRQLVVLGLYTAGFAAGRAIDRRHEALSLEVEVTAREAARAEALLVTAREEIDRVLASESGGLFSSLRLGVYDVGRLLGRGGVGEVYEARHAVTGQLVALKLLRRDRAAEAWHARRLRSEATALGRVRSDHVARIVDGGDLDDEIPFVAMEFIRGTSLAALLRERPSIDRATLAELVRDVGRGLGDVHAAGVLHLDIKPGNLIRSAGAGGWLLVDFGTAQLIDTGTGPLVSGTPSYMSPEQARGDALDPRSDLYSFSLVLYRAVTGRPAFAVRDPGEVETATAGGPPDPRAYADLSPDLELVLRIGLAASSDDRFASAAELGDAFAAALGDCLPAPLRRRGAELLARQPWRPIDPTLSRRRAPA